MVKLIFLSLVHVWCLLQVSLLTRVLKQRKLDTFLFLVLIKIIHRGNNFYFGKSNKFSLKHFLKDSNQEKIGQS